MIVLHCVYSMAQETQGPVQTPSVPSSNNTHHGMAPAYCVNNIDKVRNLPRLEHQHQMSPGASYSQR